jgi:hypothetical protein
MYLYEHVPIPIFIERVRIQNLKLGYVAITIDTLAHKFLIRVSPLRVLV